MVNTNGRVREVSYGERTSHTSGEVYGEAIRRKAPKDKSNGKKISIYLLVISLWAALLAGGIFLAHKYMEESKEKFLIEIQTVRDDNKSHLDKLLIEINNLKDNMTATESELHGVIGQLELINEELELTGESISGSDESKQALTSRITDLDKQLFELRYQLKKLEEAARVY